MSNDPTPVTRRQSLLLAGGAAIAAASGLSAVPAHAAAPMLGVLRPQVYRFKLGDFEVTTLLDGVAARKGPHPIFGANQKPEDVAKLAAANNLPTGQLENGYTQTLVNTGKELILFDTGLGPRMRGKGLGNMRKLLQQAGYKPDQIDIVVITHCHPDHIGGLMEGDKPAFPNARYVIGATEYDFWKSGNLPKNRLAVRGMFNKLVVPHAPKMKMIKAGDAIASGVTSIDLAGHTPGHLGYRLESNGKQLVIWADASNHYVMSLQRPDWHVSFDMDKEKAGQTRKKLFDMVNKDGIPVIGYHMPFPSVGFLEKASAGGYRWTPASYQLTL